MMEKLTEQELVRIQKALENAKSEYDKVLGALESAKSQVAEIEEVKCLMESQNMKLSQALATAIEDYETKIAELEPKLENYYKQFMEEYSGLI